MINSVKTNSPQSFGKKPHVPVKIGVVDRFDAKDRMIDINGDEHPDLTHGEFSEYIMKSELDFVPVFKRFPVKHSKSKSKESDYISQELDKIKKDKNVKYVNMSIGSKIPYGLISAVMTALKKDDKELKPDNLFKYKTLINNFLPPSKKVMNKIEGLSKDKKIFLAAGNEANEEFNPLGLAENKDKNIFNVGALNPDSTKWKYSADNETVNYFAKGVYNVMPIRKDGTVKGYDINDDGVSDIPISKVQGYNVIRKFVGRDISRIKASDEEYEAIKKPKTHSKTLGSKLFSLHTLFEKGFIKVPGYTENPYPKDLYMDAGTFYRFNGTKKTGPVLFFQAKQDGRIIYDPSMGEKAPSAVVPGTSCAAPRALAEIANEDFRLGRLTGGK